MILGLNKLRSEYLLLQNQNNTNIFSFNFHHHFAVCHNNTIWQ